MTIQTLNAKFFGMILFLFEGFKVTVVAVTATIPVETEVRAVSIVVTAIGRTKPPLPLWVHTSLFLFIFHQNSRKTTSFRHTNPHQPSLGFGAKQAPSSPDLFETLNHHKQKQNLLL